MVQLLLQGLLTLRLHNPEARFARVQHIPPLRLWWDDIREREVQFLIINVRGIELFFSRYTLRVRETAPLSLQLRHTKEHGIKRVITAV